jgi:hypothetical protein
MPDFLKCQANPALPGCEIYNTGRVDCSNPTMAATNKVCICATNPREPICLNSQSAGGGSSGGISSGASGKIDPSSRLAEKSAGKDFGGDIPDGPSIAQGKPNGSGGAESLDGKQGGGASLGGGGGGGGEGPASGSKAQQASAEAAVHGGFYSGNSGGTRFGFGGSGSSGASGMRFGGSPALTAEGLPEGPDLRKFLPGGQFDPKRGISGVGGADGLTGPNSNNWEKIKNRYQVMSPTLLP